MAATCEVQYIWIWGDSFGISLVGILGVYTDFKLGLVTVYRFGNGTPLAERRCTCVIVYRPFEAIHIQTVPTNTGEQLELSSRTAIIVCPSASTNSRPLYSLSSTRRQ